jgi:hypothetical protein
MQDWENLKGEGIYDSSGAFSLDWNRMRQGYAHLGQADPTLSLCKFFQAAVALAPPRIDLTIEPGLWKFHWNGGQLWDTSSLELLLAALTGAQTSLSRSLQHVLWGLRFCLDQVEVEIGTAEARLVVGERGPRWGQPEPDGRGVFIALSRPRARWKPSQVLDITYLRWAREEMNWPGTCRFLERVRHGPVPLYVQGQRVDWAKPWAWRETFDERVLASWLELPVQPQEAKIAVPVLWRSCNSFFFCQGQEMTQLPSTYLVDGRLQALRCMHLTLQEGPINPTSGQVWTGCPDQLIFYSDGIAVKTPQPWLQDFGVAMILDVGHLPTDATQLELVEGAELRLLYQQCIQDVRSFLTFLQERTPVYKPPSLLRSWFVTEKGLSLARWLPDVIHRCRPLLLEA